MGKNAFLPAHHNILFQILKIFVKNAFFIITDAILGINSAAAKTREQRLMKRMHK